MEHEKLRNDLLEMGIAEDDVDSVLALYITCKLNESDFEEAMYYYFKFGILNI